MSQETVYDRNGPTTKTSPNAIFAAIAFSCVMLGGVWQIGLALRNINVSDFPSTLQDFREGRTTGGLEKRLDHKLPARNALIAFANSIRYLLVRGGGDKVRPGLDNWLFSVEEFEFFNDFQSHAKKRIDILSDAGYALKSQGVTLVIALVPDKARLYSEKLRGGHYPYWYADRYNAILEALSHQGVAAVNLLPLLKSNTETMELYYRTDTHWNQHGAQRAAAAVAERVKAAANDLPKTSFVTTSTGSLTQRTGDLLRMMGLGNMPNWARPLPDEESLVRTEKKASSQTGGLFDTASVPVVLLGTSYSLRGNFHGYLQQALGSEVLNVARDGAGFIQSARDYLTDESFKTAKPTVIVWEIPERVFSAPLTDAEKQSLIF